MKLSWKASAIIAVIVVIGGSAVVWQVQRRKADERKFTETANARRVRAEQGDPKAESELAYMYSHGQGVPQDYSEALRWRRKAADQGYADGENGLAFMYLYGQGVSQDYSEALRWYRMASLTWRRIPRNSHSRNERGAREPREAAFLMHSLTHW